MGMGKATDDYWTMEVQVRGRARGCSDDSHPSYSRLRAQTSPPYSDHCTEPNWQLQAIVVALSTGPNGPSDKIGRTNASLVLSTVRGDGYTLKVREARVSHPAPSEQAACAPAASAARPPRNGHGRGSARRLCACGRLCSQGLVHVERLLHRRGRRLLPLVRHEPGPTARLAIDPCLHRIIR